MNKDLQTSLVICGCLSNRYISSSYSSPQEPVICVRSVNSGVADRAVGISDRRLVMERGDARHIGLGNGTVTFDAELPDRTAVKHFGIARSMG